MFLSGKGLSVNKLSRKYQPDNIFRISVIVYRISLGTLQEELVLACWRAVLHLCFDFYFFRLMAKIFINPCFTNGYDVLGGGFENEYFFRGFSYFLAKIWKSADFLTKSEMGHLGDLTFRDFRA